MTDNVPPITPVNLPRSVAVVQMDGRPLHVYSWTDDSNGEAFAAALVDRRLRDDECRRMTRAIANAVQKREELEAGDFSFPEGAKLTVDGKEYLL